MFDRAQALDTQFKDRVRRRDLPQSHPNYSLSDVGLTPAQLVDLFDTQLMSRHLDVMARRTKGKTFYSIGSSGHEGLAAIALASRLDDMAFLHYRDAAFTIQRRKQVTGSTPLYDMALSFAASAEDPVSGGRHKVLGGKDIFTPPQTSTIASHLPKAVGMAHSIGLSRTLKNIETVVPIDSVVLCSFGDASANHSTAQGAINAAAWAAYQHSPMPIVFLCEDNNIGISVRTPSGWIEANYSRRPGLAYRQGNGLDVLDAYAAARDAFHYARTRRRPVFLHLKTVRLMGHAGADIEASYTALEKIEAAERQDPLLHTAHTLLDHQILSTDDILSRYDEMEARVSRAAEEACARPRLTEADKIKESIVAGQNPNLNKRLASDEEKKALFAKDQRQLDKPLNMARQIGFTLSELMLDYPEILVFGEDVARKGGVYSVTTGLLEKFGPARVMDTLLDEQTILGLAIGAAQNGFIPIPEIQFLAYLHNAEDQVRGEAATLSFFSNGQFTNPMVIRIAGLAYQKGFGGHFHNDNSFAVLRDIPGLIVACPSNGADASAMLRECIRLAYEEQRVVIFLEPIALYMTADLHTEGDKKWLSMYQSAGATSIPLGEPHIHGDGTDLCILTYANGYYLSRQAAKELEQKHGLITRIMDLRWLKPLNEEAILQVVQDCAHILVVDECRKTGSVSEEIITLLQQQQITKPIGRVTAEDCFIPLGPAANVVLPSKEQIVEASLALTLGTAKEAAQ